MLACYSVALPRSPMTHELPPRIRAESRVASFGYAFEGLRYLFGTQRNAQIHMGITILTVVLGFFFGISRLEWVAVVLTIGLVIAAEGLNTAVEAVVDLASPGRHPLAKIAKDVAAGTVLLTAFCAVVVGLLVFVPPFVALLTRLLGWP